MPWSFLDTDDDGRGNLNGIIDKLDYVSALGVDAIWLTPIYESPMDDLGYDITDMLDVDPVIGDLTVFDKLLALTQARGLRMVVDQVWGHTSDRHFWFLKSSESRDNPKANWYVWADPKPDSIHPDNPMAKLMFQNSFCRPEALDILSPVHELIDQYPSTVTLAEVTLCEDSIVLSSEYVHGNHRAHLAYGTPYPETFYHQAAASSLGARSATTALPRWPTGAAWQRWCQNRRRHR